VLGVGVGLVGSAAGEEGRPTSRVAVVGSVNWDVFTQVERLPGSGENVMAVSAPGSGVGMPGGKGGNQAMAAARLCGASCAASFSGKFGGDAAGEALRRALREAGVDVGASEVLPAPTPSGQGLVFVEPGGVVSAVVIPGANAAWGEGPRLPEAVEAQVRAASAVLLQREVPEWVNAAAAEAAAAAGVPVFQDVGGEERALSAELLARVRFVSPNLSELRRVLGAEAVGPLDSDEAVVAAARRLQAMAGPGATLGVLVTLGGRGSVLLEHDGTVHWQAALPPPQGGAVVDETGAGDAFRAAFAVRFAEGAAIAECLAFAACAGAHAVSRLGAYAPPRSACDGTGVHDDIEAGGEEYGTCSTAGPGGASSCEASSSKNPPAASPRRSLLFSTRLNSMKVRPELAGGGATGTPGLIARAASAGMDLVDLNFPQHFAGYDVAVEGGGEAGEASIADIQRALGEYGIKVGFVSLRFDPAGPFALGTLTHPDAEVRSRAIRVAIQGGKVALELGAEALVFWSATDGYDYPGQLDYEAAWERSVSGFRAVCDALPQLRVGYEYKPTDESSRFSVVPSAGAARLLVEEVGRTNAGVFLDVGHALMAGENPAQSAALVGLDRLVGVHLNDGHSRLGAEDGLVFGSVHRAACLELLAWLFRMGYQGHLAFDTFPRTEDPEAEARLNVERATELWRLAEDLVRDGVWDRALAAHDALQAVRLFS